MSRMNWDSLLVEERFGTETKKSEDGRSQFQKDIDRITFSSAFRRLGRKTQVHPLNENDHIHTRLSHSLEVACVGRSLGVMIGNFLANRNELPEGIYPMNIGEIVHAACLAHDIGNPPFGHAGEEVIRKWFEQAFDDSNLLKDRLVKKDREKDFTCFDGNAMAFRVTTFKEYYTGSGGMRLTFPTIGATLKYPWTSHSATPNNKFGCFQSEAKILKEVGSKLGLIEKVCKVEEQNAKYVRHPLAFLVEAADDICYKILDLEDATELGLLVPDFIDSKFRRLLVIKKHEEELLKSAGVSHRTKNAFLRGKTMELIISDVFDVFVGNYDGIMNGEFQTALTETDKKESCTVLNDTYENVKDEVYASRRTTLLEIGAFSTLGKMLSIFSDAAYQICYLEENRRTYKTRKIMELLGTNFPGGIKDEDPNSLYIALLLMLDYVTGMTDHYATIINKKILGLGI